MTDEERLVEIEARRERHSEWRLGESGLKAMIWLDEPDYDWLIARIRELEAQAERDGVDMEAAQKQLVVVAERVEAQRRRAEEAEDVVWAYILFEAPWSVLANSLDARGEPELAATCRALKEQFAAVRTVREGKAEAPDDDAAFAARDAGKEAKG